MRPVVDRLYETYGDTVQFAVLNPNESQEINALANQFRVTAVPTFVFVDSSGNEVARTIGTASEEQLAEQIEALE
jgi:thioredoxin-related protein